MNVAVIAKASRARTELLDPHWLHLAARGVTLWAGDPQVSRPPWTPDVVISMGVTLMEETFAAVARWPDARLYCYNWDVYEWVWTRPRAEETPGTPGFLDYNRYGELLRLAHEVWTPSDCTSRRTQQWYPWVKHVRRILSSCPWWEYPCKECVNGTTREYATDSIGEHCTACNGTGSGIRDDGYALCCLREIPDPWWGVFEKCCTELGIPFKSTRHECSEAEYRDAIAGCRFICAPLYELSTGGLSLMEAYYHGKPVLINGSEWNGGRDYFGGRASYFMPGDEDGLKPWLRSWYDSPPTVPPDHRSYITANFSPERMADDILARVAR